MSHPLLLEEYFESEVGKSVFSHIQLCTGLVSNVMQREKKLLLYSESSNNSARLGDSENANLKVNVQTDQLFTR